MQDFFGNDVEYKIKKILSNLDLELILESPDQNYTFTYSTNIVAQEIEQPLSLSRNYWLSQKINGSNISAPWDEYDEIKQVTLVSNLIKHSKYRIKGIYSCWKITCPICKLDIEGKIWRNSPKRCRGSEIKDCDYMFTESDKKMILYDINKSLFM
jgi:hypothetical protein